MNLQRTKVDQAFPSSFAFGLGPVSFGFLCSCFFLLPGWCFLFFIYFYLSILDLQCCADLCYTAKWLSIYVYILFFNIIFHLGLSQEIVYSSVLYSRTLFSIHSECNSLHLLAPKSLSIPLPQPLSSHKSVLHVCESDSVLWIGSFVPSTYKWYHMVFIFLFLTYFI